MVNDVADDTDRIHTLRLTADGAVPATSTHGTKYHAIPPTNTRNKQTLWYLAVALVYARRLSYDDHTNRGNTHRDLVAPKSCLRVCRV